MPNKPPNAPLSSSEQAIMDAIWRSHPAGVMEVLEVVNAGRSEPITRNTLQTQLARMEAKGWLKRDTSVRAHAFSPAVAESKGKKSVLAGLKERFFGGSGMELVRCLVDNGEISAEELDELRKLVRQREKVNPKPARKP